MSKEKEILAFPMYNELGELNETGMTLRDYFASKAMNGICVITSELMEDKYTVNGGWHHPETIAKISYEIADAMLKAREK